MGSWNKCSVALVLPGVVCKQTFIILSEKYSTVALWKVITQCYVVGRNCIVINCVFHRLSHS